MVNVLPSLTVTVAALLSAKRCPEPKPIVSFICKLPPERVTVPLAPNASEVDVTRVPALTVTPPVNRLLAIEPAPVNVNVPFPDLVIPVEKKVARPVMVESPLFVMVSPPARILRAVNVRAVILTAPKARASPPVQVPILPVNSTSPLPALTVKACAPLAL